MNVEQTAGAAAQVAPTPQQRLTLWYILRRWPILPVSLLALLAIMGIGADWIAPNDPIDQSLPDRNARPLYQDGSPYFFGGDHVGRDVLSRVIHGARVSLSVMAVALSAGMLIGCGLGLLAGYAGGFIDELITRIVDIWMGFPFLLLALVAAIIVGASFQVVMVLMILVAWVSFVRNVRADVLVLKGKRLRGIGEDFRCIYYAHLGASHTAGNYRDDNCNRFAERRESNPLRSHAQLLGRWHTGADTLLGQHGIRGA